MRFLFLLLPCSVQMLFAAQMPAFKGNAAKAKEEKSKIEGAGSFKVPHSESRETLLKEEWVEPLNAQDRKMLGAVIGDTYLESTNVLEQNWTVRFTSLNNKRPSSFTPSEFYNKYCKESSDEQFTFYAYLISQAHTEIYLHGNEETQQLHKRHKLFQLISIIKTEKKLTQKQLSELKKHVKNAKKSATRHTMFLPPLYPHVMPT